MFEHLARYDKILVTGPQRSGTTVAAKAISQDTGHRYVDEDEYGVHSEEAFIELLEGSHRIVIQCPTMSHIVHQVATSDTLVVMMMRDCDDIRASEERVEWTVGVYQELYRFGMSPRQARSYRKKGGQVAPLKYRRWQEEQRDLIPHWLELEYESLSGHPLWVPKEQRTHFEARQIA